MAGGGTSKPAAAADVRSTRPTARKVPHLMLYTIVFNTNPSKSGIQSGTSFDANKG